MNNSRKIGVFGGTFDPPHFGHLKLASEACIQLRLDCVLWVITPDPPHKQMRSITPVGDRLAMVQIAIKDNPIFELSCVDVERPGPYYTVDTIQIISRRYIGAKLIFLMGSDLLQSFPSWIGSNKLVSMCHSIGIVKRPGEPVDFVALEKTIPGITSKIQIVNISSMDVSSHEIRAAVTAGRSYDNLLPDGVCQYIKDHNLYR
jgi:nicotinate-nucleotide adenylyltransferase